MKKYKITFLSLVFALTLAVSCLFGTTLNAFAAVSSTSNVFTATAGATLAATKVNDADYLSFSFTDKARISYRQDLALNWVAEEEGQPKDQCFSVSFLFENTDFATLSLTFESAQYSKTADGTTKNEIVFEKSEEAVTVSVNDGAKTAVAVDATVKLALAKMGGGVYAVAMNGEEIGEFTNIGGNYFEYKSSSSSTPRTPLVFAAEGVTDALKMAMLNMNGQEFLLDEQGEVIDNAAPVVVLKEEVKQFILGYAISLNYEVIDVVHSAPSATLYYKQYGVEYKNDQDEAEEYQKYSTSLYLFESGNETGDYVRMYFSVKDDRATAEADATLNVQLDWYADDEDLTLLTSTFNGVDKTEYYFTLDRNEVGPEYVCIENDAAAGVSVLDENNAELLAYQAAVEAAALDEEGNSIEVGEGHYFYLPSLEQLIVDDNTAYTGLKFNIYYKTSSGTSVESVLSKSYDSLEIEIPKAGLYVFKVIATDKTGNAMYAYYNGRLVKVTGNNVFNIDAIPSFSFTVYNRGASIEEVENVKDGYVGINYAITDFTVKAIAGYSSAYTLYYFDNARYMAENGATSYPSDLVSNPTAYSQYFVEIEEYNSNLEEDEGDNAYNWQESSLTFTPVEEGYYILKLSVRDAQLWGNEVVAHQVIRVGSQADKVAGESDWIKNNWVSIMLLCFIVVMIIAIICVCVFMKPGDETLLESVDEEIVSSGKKKK